MNTNLICYKYSIFILFAGFIIPPPMIPDWWIWLYYLSPFHYALEGLMINELENTPFTCTQNEVYVSLYHYLSFSLTSYKGTHHLNTHWQTYHTPQATQGIPSAPPLTAKKSSSISPCTLKVIGSGFTSSFSPLALFSSWV
jgi:ABC-2 type transporter